MVNRCFFILFSLAAICANTSITYAQNDNKPDNLFRQSDSPTLDETISFIKRKVAENGTAIEGMYYHGVVLEIKKVSEVRFDGCKVTATLKSFWNSATPKPEGRWLVDEELEVDLRDINPETVVSNPGDPFRFTEMTTKGELDKVNYTVKKYLDVERTKLDGNPKTYKVPTMTVFASSTKSGPEIAERITRAFKHAVKLCNGLNPKEPF